MAPRTPSCPHDVATRLESQKMACAGCYYYRRLLEAVCGFQWQIWGKTRCSLASGLSKRFSHASCNGWGTFGDAVDLGPGLQDSKSSTASCRRALCALTFPLTGKSVPLSRPSDIKDLANINNIHREPAMSSMTPCAAYRPRFSHLLTGVSSHELL
jgi:hypothetical protein